MSNAFLKSISLTNVLSFGDKTCHIELNPLNILIGHNGSGKSNLIECISLLQAAPKGLSIPVREGGGIADWLWKGSAITPEASIGYQFKTGQRWTRKIVPTLRRGNAARDAPASRRRAAGAAKAAFPRRSVGTIQVDSGSSKA